MTVAALAVEEHLAASLSISPSQLRFTVCLFACIPVGWCQRQIRSVVGGHLFGIVTGLLLIYLPFGSGVVHVVPPLLFTFAALHLVPRSCGSLVWLICFPHLIYIHYVNASGAAWQDGAMDATGALMILFLRMAAIAQCRQDAACHSAKSKRLGEYQKQKMIHTSPSLLEFLGYAFGFGNLLSGPFAEFTDYKNYIEGKDLWSEPLPPRLIPFFKVFCMSLIYMGVFVFLGTLFPYTLFFSDRFRNASLGEKYILTYVITFSYRLRYYFAWSVAEAGSIASGFGYSGTSNGANGHTHHKWERCKNVTVLETEFATSLARVPAYWNTCTGIFLRRYVYDRLTPSGGRPTFFTLLATQIVSAFWHGLYPGYFLFFATAAVAISASKTLHRWEQGTSVSTMPLYRICKMAYSMMTLSYAGSAFMILSLKESLELYASMRFIPHFLSLGICLIGPLIPKNKPGAPKSVPQT